MQSHICLGGLICIEPQKYTGLFDAPYKEPSVYQVKDAVFLSPWDLAGQFRVLSVSRGNFCNMSEMFVEKGLALSKFQKLFVGLNQSNLITSYSAILCMSTLLRYKSHWVKWDLLLVKQGSVCSYLIPWAVEQQFKKVNPLQISPTQQYL